MWTMDQKVRTSIRELDGGVQCNVVSPMATAFLDGTGDMTSYRYMLSKLGYEGEVLDKDGGSLIRVMGKAAHASRPEEGVNATVRLLELIGDCNR